MTFWTTLRENGAFFATGFFACLLAFINGYCWLITGPDNLPHVPESHRRFARATAQHLKYLVAGLAALVALWFVGSLVIASLWCIVRYPKFAAVLSAVLLAYYTGRELLKAVQ